MSSTKPRRTLFFPRCWCLDDCLQPLAAVSELLTIVHDIEGEGGAGCDEMRQDLLISAD